MSNHYLEFREVDRDKFDAILAGSKTIETRAATDKYRSIKTGDHITFVCDSDAYTTIVTKAEHFESIDAILACIPFTQVLPSATSATDLQNAYYRFSGYEEKIRRYGLMAFHLASDVHGTASASI